MQRTSDVYLHIIYLIQFHCYIPADLQCMDSWMKLLLPTEKQIVQRNKYININADVGAYIILHTIIKPLS